MRKKVLVFLVVILAISIVVAGSLLFIFPYEPTNPPTADDSGSTQEGIQQVVDANNQFAFGLYNSLSENETGNLFYSPYSISTALAMTYEGAEGQTAEEMKTVFHFPEFEILRPNSAAIYNLINKNNKDYELSTGNALWVQYDYPFFYFYTSRDENYYGGKAAEVDFVGETEKSRQTINEFIEKQTKNKIVDLISQGMLSPMTRLVLTNAIYFKGDWVYEFDEGETRDREFSISENEKINVPTMYMKSEDIELNYANLEKLQILELPYKGNDTSMLIILPKQGNFFDYEKGEQEGVYYTLEDINLSYEKLEEYKSQMNETKLAHIILPKFKFETEYLLNDVLSSMGMPTAFDQVLADFSGMGEMTNLVISKIIHKAYIDVNEKGTEAAAATAVIMQVRAAFGGENFEADHPFIFIIQEKETGEILFMGRVADPTQ